jgi:hypothetical protein
VTKVVRDNATSGITKQYQTNRDRRCLFSLSCPWDAKLPSFRIIIYTTVERSREIRYVVFCVVFRLGEMAASEVGIKRE